MKSLNQVYYTFKPFLPWGVRIALRRLHANYKRLASVNVWPIDEKAGVTPPGWPGWPSGKQFAVVLTHDVEGCKGVARVEQLMDLELKHGLRSSFNFVPEGEYRVEAQLRRKLELAGFEVGVHGLKHDGKLYFSKAKFSERATRINAYLRDWGAVGFRSPLMQHRLAWLHQISAEYDASTFDTDPFEPEPDGAGTIFPFWVTGLGGGGYVELPYTLVQDFTLFITLQERTIDIWKRKVEWIAARGGMVLLNTHPDYMCFEGEPRKAEFSVSLYDEFLGYLRQRFEGAFWTALPLEVANYYRASLPLSSRNSRKKICMLTHSTYENDNRVRRYAEALAKRGDHVDVFALSGGKVPLGLEELRGVNVYRIQRRDRNERHRWTYAWRLLRFLVTSSALLTRRHRRIRYDIVHVHNIPDFLVFAAWYPKWTGVKLILDIHDIVPELFASKFETKTGDQYVKFLKKIEKASATFADHVIVSNHLWYERLISRSVPKEKCSVFLNHVDPAIFYRRSRTRTDDKFIVLFPGSFQWHQGLDIAIEAFTRIKHQVPHAEFHIYGGGGQEAELVRMIQSRGLDRTVRFCGSLPLEEIAGVMADADLGVVPKRADSFGNEAYSTKIMEFMSQGVPVVASRTKIDSFYFDDNVVRFFTSGESESMADAMMDVIEHKGLRDALVSRGYEYVSRNGWDSRKNDYLALVDSLSTETFRDSNSPEPVATITSHAAPLSHTQPDSGKDAKAEA